MYEDDEKLAETLAGPGISERTLRVYKLNLASLVTEPHRSLSNLTEARAQAREPGGGWALGSQASIVNKKIKVDKQVELFSMGFYEKIKKQTQ